jgi:hypothetical protein
LRPTDDTGVALSHANRTLDWAVPVLFYSRENQEPPHIHVERDENVAKWAEAGQVDPSR